MKVYADTASGARSDRAALAGVLAGAHRREFDVLLIWSLDRLTREGISAMIRYMDQLRAGGIRRIGERVRAGQTRARAHGVHIGRKPRAVDVEEVRRRRADGQGWRRIARAMRTPMTTLRRKFGSSWG